MDVFGQLKNAQLENTSTDPSKRGQIILDTDDTKVKYYDGSAVRTVVNTDESQTLEEKTIVVADNTITTAATGNLAATELNAALAELQADIDTRALDSDLDAHTADTADAHDASAISVVPAGNLAADDVQEALEELQTDVDTRALDSDLDAHLADTTDAHDASAISCVASGNLGSTNVQDALEELQGDIDSAIINPMDDAGQLIYGGASGAPTKLDAGTDGYIFHGAGAAAPKWLPSVDPQAAINYSLAISVASNAMTIALKDAAGNDPSSSSPCKFAFRDADENTGKSSIVKVTSALSLTVPSGATLGSINFNLQDYYVFVLNNAGTVELAVMGMNAPEGFISGYGFGQSDGFTTTVAISSSADNAHEMYSDSARTGVPYRLIGRFRATQNTAGAWAGNPTYIQLLPIARSLEVKSASGASTVGSSSGSWVTPSGSGLILTPGVWRLRGFLQFFRNGGTSNLTGILGVWSESTNASVGIGTGSNFTDLAGGNSGPYLSFNTAPELDAYILNAADKLILVKRTASIYYNVQLVAGTPANFTFNTGIWAERVL